VVRANPQASAAEMEHAAPERYIHDGFCCTIEPYMATRQPLVEIYPALDSASI